MHTVTCHFNGMLVLIIMEKFQSSFIFFLTSFQYQAVLNLYSTLLVIIFFQIKKCMVIDLSDGTVFLAACNAMPS